MGLPSVNISFTEKAAQSIKKGQRGVVGLILKESKKTEVITVTGIEDIPKTLNELNIDIIKKTILGYVNAPKKIIIYFVSDAVGYKDALVYFEKNRVNWLAAPYCETDAKTADIATWIKKQRQEHNNVKAVLPNSSADNEGVVNYTTAEAIYNGKIYTAEQYSARIAGLLAGTPLTISATYAPLNELEDCTRNTKEEMDIAVDTGKLFVFHDGEKVKISRGVNSLVTTSQEKGTQFKKIKIIEALDMIDEDIRRTAEDSYLGKFSNSYDNKCLLISAIGGYFDSLKLEGILSSYKVEVDIEAQRVFLKGKGFAVEEMSDDEIKTADTYDQVFLKANIKILDAIEDITLKINI